MKEKQINDFKKQASDDHYLNYLNYLTILRTDQRRGLSRICV